MIWRLLGIDPAGPVHFEGFHFRSGWPPVLLAVLLALALVYAVILYRRETMLGRLARWLLALCRVAAMGLLLFLLFQPVFDARIDVPVRPSLLVLADNSASMAIRDTRKDLDQLAEAAMAMRRIRGDDPRLRRTVDAAVQSMQQVADALADNRTDDAVRAQEQAAQSLSTLRGDMSPGTAPEALAGLDAIVGRQEKLRSEVRVPTRGPTSETTATALQSELAGDLARWYRAQRNAGLVIPDKVKAEVASAPRIDLVKGALTDPEQNVFRGLSERLKLRYFRFGRRLEPLAGNGELSAESSAALEASAPATWLGTSLQEALDQYGTEPLSGVVVLTDGASNGGLDPLAAAARLRDRSIPLYTVGVGLARPDDLSLRGLVVPDVVFANDLVPIRVQVNANGYEKRSTVLSVRLDGAEVASKTVVLCGRPQFEQLVFKASRNGGTKAIEVSLAPLPGEATLENNTLRRTIRVVDEKIKVLCIEGSPRWEYRYLRAVLKRDPRIEVQFITTEGDPDMARASREHLARFPEKEQQAFKYDLIILGDVRASVFTPTQLARMEQLVREQGGSFILLAGHKHAPAEYVDTPIAAMLPVWAEHEKWEVLGDDVYPVLTPEGQQSSVMSLEPLESKTKALWANVKPLRRVAPLGGPKPGAKVLAELSDFGQRTSPYPLIVWQRYGAGKSMFVGTDCLWRLRTQASDKYHLRFWGQAVQFLTLSRLLGENKRTRLETDVAAGGLGQPVQVFANVLGDTYEPVRAPSYTVLVSRVGHEEAPQAVPLQAVPDMPGLYHGLYTPAVAGRYVVAAAEEDQASANTAAFDVSGASAEQTESSMQKELLERMAKLSGGRYLALRDLPLLEDLVAARPAVTSIHKQVELVDNWVLLALFVALTGVEWAWRRKKNLA
jgi:hypothetical protein